MQPFFQQTLTDGTPIWVVITRDVVLPALTIIGGAVAFFAWNLRKKKEHKLIQKTKAYEIILDKEIQCYGEIQKAVRESVKAALEIADKIKPFVYGRDSVIYEDCVADIKRQEEMMSLLFWNTCSLIDISIEELILEFQKNYMNAGSEMNSCISEALANNEGKLHSKANAVFGMLLDTERKAANMAYSIKMHLKSISRIKQHL